MMNAIGTELPATVTADRALVAHGAIMTLLGLLSGFSPFFARAPLAGLEAALAVRRGERKLRGTRSRSHYGHSVHLRPR
jgi:hypothetical protein